MTSKSIPLGPLGPFLDRKIVYFQWPVIAVIAVIAKIRIGIGDGAHIVDRHIRSRARTRVREIVENAVTTMTAVTSPYFSMGYAVTVAEGGVTSYDRTYCPVFWATRRASAIPHESKCLGWRR